MISNAKNYIRDQIRRATDRYVGKTLRVVFGRQEFKERLALVKKIKESDALPTVSLTTLGYSPIACDSEKTKAFVDRCQQRLGETKEFKQRGGKAFFSQLFTPEDYEIDGPIMRFVLDEKLLNTIARYLGSAPFLQSAELLYSRPVGGPPKASQLWHRDRLDKKVMKVFVYCLDVGPENGPFTFIPMSAGKNVPGWHFHYLSDDQMRKYVNDSSIQQLIGPAGSTLLIDSYGCYHKGSNCQQPRLAAIIDFDTGFGYQKRRGHWNIPKDKVASLSPLQKFALGYYPHN
jgi:hypothetical protein